MGVNHERMTSKYQGLDMRLTGVEEARVVKELLALQETREQFGKMGAGRLGKPDRRRRD
jgi:hypothetical protein